MTTTYYIGAGASFNSLPLVSNIPTRMELFSRLLKVKKHLSKITHSYYEQYINELDQIIHNIRESQSTSFDAYAKELYNSEKYDELLKLKAHLCSFLIFEQSKKSSSITNILKSGFKDLSDETIQHFIRHVDQRYRTFWTNVYNSKDRNPDPSIKIISWNYDMQFEYTYSRFREYSLDMSQKELQTYPSNMINNVDHNKFCILKLNGSAVIFNDSVRNKVISYFDFHKEVFEDKNFNDLIEIVYRNSMRAFLEPQIFFAWENDNNNIRQARIIAQDIIAQTTNLIVIGYSFPFYNRDIDQEIFKYTHNIRNVVIQTGQEAIQSTEERLKKLIGNVSRDFKINKNLNEFHFNY